MNRLAILSALFGVLMTGAAAAQTAEISVQPINGACPTGFDLKSATGSDDLCVQSASGLNGSGTINLASFTGGDDDGDHGSNDHDSDSD